MEMKKRRKKYEERKRKTKMLEIRTTGEKKKRR